MTHPVESTIPPATNASGQRQFDPHEHMIKLQGRDYLEVKWRLVWFRQDHPDAIISTDLVEHDRANKYAVVRAVVTIPGKGMASGYSLTEPTGVAKDYIANAETSAIGRALAHLGYGTQFAPEMDQGETLADSPVQRKQPIQAAPSRPVQQAPPPDPVMTQDQHAKVLAWLTLKSIPHEYANEVSVDIFGRSLSALTVSESQRLSRGFGNDLVRADANGRWVISKPPTEVQA